MTPIPKPVDSPNPSNYRSISSLPILSKIAEKTMASQIRAYLESNSLLAPTQYGFSENHSTESLLLQLTNNWLQTLDSTSGKKFISLTALDIQKAFDSVDHSILINKISYHFQFHTSSTNLISNYLTSRSQCVKTNGVISRSMEIASGVP